MRGMSVDHTRRLEAAWDAQEAHGMAPHRTDVELLTDDEAEALGEAEWARLIEYRKAIL